MKKLIYSLVLVLGASATASAQVAKGNLMLGGGIGYSSTGDEDRLSGTLTGNDKTSTFFFAPTVGYFFTDKIAGGLMFSYSSRKVTNEFPTAFESKSSLFGVSVFGRYYAMINDQFYFWPQVDFGFASGGSESESGGVSVEGPDESGFSAGISPGFTFFPSTRYGFDFSVGRLGVNNFKRESTSSETTISDFEFRWDMASINIGLFIFFGGE